MAGAVDVAGVVDAAAVIDVAALPTGIVVVALPTLIGTYWRYRDRHTTLIV